jgi:hypothetical protein
MYNILSNRPNILTNNAPAPARISPPVSAPKPRLLGQVRLAIRARHYSPEWPWQWVFAATSHYVNVS